MALPAGHRLGPYEIVATLGAGGMGEVYRARDARLDRDVAIKVLPESFAADPDRVARFEREAKTLASLNHPHIAQIYGIEEGPTGGGRHVRALVLELVEGPTLADRIRHGAMALEDALPIAKQIAEALEAAHEHGVVHRDLKPANIKLRPDGAVKVLDFGLAKALHGDVPAIDASQSPTLSVAATRTGVVLGTAAYMAPEQATGKPVDRRADIWAFGCVLYEMLAGKRAFPGDDVSEILAGVIKSAPDWQALPVGTPPQLRALLRRCLHKDITHRIRDIGDARLEIDEILTVPGHVPPATALPPPPGRARLAWPVAGVLLVALGATLGVLYLRTPASAPEMRVEVTTPATADPMSFAISPDGRALVFVASGDGPSRLWLRPLDGAAAQPLAGTEGVAYPFWSPDNRSVAFFADGRLKRIDMGGGRLQTLANAPSGRGGTWNDDGVILFAPTVSSTLFRVPASGGNAVAVTKLGAGQGSHRFPSFLPGGRQFLFFAQGRPDARGIHLGSLDAPDATRLTDADTFGLYAPPGWLLFVRQGTLVARRVDASRKELTGEPVTMADAVGFDDNTNGGAFSASAAGVIAYRAGVVSRRQLIWFDRSGKALGTVGAPDENGLSFPVLSPDGRRVAVQRTVQGNIDIWLLDNVRTTRFTFDASLDRAPAWSPDGSRIFFDSDRKGYRDLYLSNGAGREELVLESPQDKVANDWSADGRFLLYMTLDDPKTAFDLWVLPLEGDKKPFVFVNGRFEESLGQFSPDNRWVAYVSNESGGYEVYVRPFPTSGAQWQISAGGGIWPRWRPDGRELYYIAPDGSLMAASITVTGETLDASRPAALFQTRILGGGTTPYLAWQYAVAPDSRFLINVTSGEATAPPITLILNWRAGTQN